MKSPAPAKEAKKIGRIPTETAATTVVIETLKRTLADEYILQLKTQNCHWNIEGPLFFSLHKLFEDQYGQIADFVDRTAESLRALKTHAPGSFREFLELASVQEISSERMNAGQIVETLSQDHTNMAIALKARLEVAEDAEETSAVVLYEDLVSFHEKAAWMIRSHKA